MKYPALILLLDLSFQLVAQDEVQVTQASQSSYDSIRSIHIKSFPDHFFLWPVLKQRRLDFELKNIPDRNKSVTYRSNKPYSLGLGMYLFEVGVELTFAIPLDEKSKNIYGESDASDLQLAILTKKWGLDLYHQKYSGFYIDDPEVHIPQNTPYPQRPDIATKNIGILGNYVFNNKKFSFRSAYNFAERQLHSKGSFLLFASIRGFNIQGDSAILGDKYSADFGIDSKINKIKTTSFSIAPGYTYSLIHKGFFLNATLAVGPAHNWLTYQTEDGKTKDDIEFRSFYVLRIGLGYNGDHFFGGLTFVDQGSSVKFDTVQFSSSSGTVKILFGYRFREVGFLKKKAADVPKAVGF